MCTFIDIYPFILVSDTIFFSAGIYYTDIFNAFLAMKSQQLHQSGDDGQKTADG